MALLDGKVALVTGGTAGLGRATVLALVQAGATVVFTGRNSTGAEETLQRLHALGLTARFLPHDVTLAADWERVFTDLSAHEGRLDILVNNAGVSRLQPLETLTMSDVEYLVGVNVIGMYLGIRHAFALMEHNADRAGSIVNISALNALRGSPNSTAYSLAKGGTTQLARAAALEGRRHGRRIRVNAIHPGVLFEEGDRPSPGAIALYGEAGAQEFVRRNIETTPLGRLGHPRDIGNAVVFLASDAAANITGAEIVIDGGRSAGEFATHHGVRSQR
ncbi:MAG: SDR family oxidoreductase [Steroidobacteraceae bacterium]|nr:SDR family oxidoreductase [Steroidobacteraceae bacterium]MDW8258396.1 SDR family NAD(P)-dependent oxidoreductase [Gammaproteobacteria bacterium]